MPHLRAASSQLTLAKLLTFIKKFTNPMKIYLRGFCNPHFSPDLPLQKMMLGIFGGDPNVIISLRRCDGAKAGLQLGKQGGVTAG